MHARPHRSTFAAIALLALALPAPAFAAWPHDPATNLVVCGDPAAQTMVRSVADGFGNTIHVWRDLRQGGAVIYAQRLRPDGTACWAPDGVPLCNQVTYATNPVLVPDGAGGAIVAWEDGRPGNSYDVYSQRVDSTGARLWNGGGVPLSTADWTQHYLAIAADGAGGAIVAWSDERFGLAEDVYAQRVNASGLTRWATNGVLVCNVATYKFPPAVVADGTGGAYVMWSDCRTQIARYDAYVQRISSGGTVQWTANGVRAMTGLLDQSGAALVPDATGGCIAVTYGKRGATASYDIGLQRYTSAGAVRWGTSGATLVAGDGYRQQIRAIADGRGGVLVAWMVDDADAGNIAVARADSNGVATWSASGVPVCTAVDQQWSPTLASDGAGGAVIAWEDHRTGVDADVYAQRVNASGSPLWTANGVALSLASGDQATPGVLGDGAGGLTCAWADLRTGTSDIVAQWLDGSGQLGGPVTAVGPGAMAASVALAPPAPNPARGEVSVAYVLPARASVRLTLLDVLGRQVRVLEQGERAAGNHAVELRAEGLPAGLYFVRLGAGALTCTRRLVVVQ